MTLIDDATRTALESRITSFNQAREAASDAQGPQRQAWRRRMDDLALDLVNSIPDGPQDHDARCFLQFHTELMRAFENRDGSGMDKANMKVTDVLRRLSEVAETQALEDPAWSMRTIESAFDGVPNSQLSGILGVDAKTVGNWKTGKAIRDDKVDRVRLVAQCARFLSATFTPTGLSMWFNAPLAGRPDRKTPVMLMDEDLAGAWTALTTFARAGRG